MDLGPAAGADLSHGLSLLKVVLEGRKSQPSRRFINKCLPSECAISAVHLPNRWLALQKILFISPTSLISRLRSFVSSRVQLPLSESYTDYRAFYVALQMQADVCVFMPISLQLAGVMIFTPNLM